MQISMISGTAALRLKSDVQSANPKEEGRTVFGRSEEAVSPGV